MTSLLKYLGRFDEVEEQLQSIREKGRLDEWARQAAYYYPSMRRYDDALNMFDIARDSEDVTWKADLELSTAMWNRLKGDFGNARKVLKDIEPALPSGRRAEYDLEWAALEAASGNIERALERAIKAHEEAAGYQYNRNVFSELLARLYFARGQVGDARKALAAPNGFYNSFVVFYRRAQMAVVTQSADADRELSRALLLAARASRGSDFMQSLGEARIYSALASARRGDPKRARREILYAIKLEPERADIAYSAAAAYSLIGDAAMALQWLEASLERGYQELWWARVDPDLDTLRELPRFNEIMDEWERRIEALID
jgi:hypothetical protein